MLANLDRQLHTVRDAQDAPDLADAAWERLATAVYREVVNLGDEATNQLRIAMFIPPERYVEELLAFQTWMDIARANAADPAIVRAQVMTELYVAFVWLRDSLMNPIAERLGDDTTFGVLSRFLNGGRRRLLRNAVAHGRWCYLPDFSGLECWAEPSRGQKHERFEIHQVDIDAWQLLSRGTAIAALLALTEGE